MDYRYQINDGNIERLVPSPCSLLIMNLLMWIGSIAAVLNLLFQIFICFSIPQAILVIIVYAAATILGILHFYYRVKEIGEGKNENKIWKTILMLIYCSLHIIGYFSIIIANQLNYSEWERQRKEKKEDGADFWLLISVLMIIFFTGGSILSIWYISFLLVNQWSEKHLVKQSLPYQHIQNVNQDSNML